MDHMQRHVFNGQMQRHELNTEGPWNSYQVMHTINALFGTRPTPAVPYRVLAPVGLLPAERGKPVRAWKPYRFWNPDDVEALIQGNEAAKIYFILVLDGGECADHFACLRFFNGTLTWMDTLVRKNENIPRYKDGKVFWEQRLKRWLGECSSWGRTIEVAKKDAELPQYLIQTDKQVSCALLSLMTALRDAPPPISQPIGSSTNTTESVSNRS